MMQFRQEHYRLSPLSRLHSVLLFCTYLFSLCLLSLTIPQLRLSISLHSPSRFYDILPSFLLAIPCLIPFNYTLSLLALCISVRLASVLISSFLYLLIFYSYYSFPSFLFLHLTFFLVRFP